MFTFTIVFILVQMLITTEFLMMIAGMIDKLPTVYLRYWTYRIVRYRPIAFLLDLLISGIISYFTGEGMTAGFANLVSGILVSWYLPYLMEWKFHFSKLEDEYERRVKARKARSPLTGIRNLFGKSKPSEPKPA